MCLTLSFGIMWMICLKEWRQFFNTITGYLAVILFLILNGLFLFVFPNTSLLNFGYASLEYFFELSPWVFLFFIPTVTMRTFSEEYQLGTIELLKTLPLTSTHIIIGKFLGALLIILFSLVPTFVYAVSIQQLSAVGGLDVGATIGSYIGLFLLSAVFVSVGMCVSSFTANSVFAFIGTAFICFILFTGFEAISYLPVFSNGADYYVEMLGINFHYKSLSRGVIDAQDVLYFLIIVVLFLIITWRNVMQR